MEVGWGKEREREGKKRWREREREREKEMQVHRVSIGIQCIVENGGSIRVHKCIDLWHSY